MNWEEVGAIGQVLGAIAVFVTLAYLAVQVRHARGKMRRSISQNRGETLRQLAMTYATDERVGNLTRKSELLLGAPEFPFVRELTERTGMPSEEATTVFWTRMAWWHYRAHTIPYLRELRFEERQHFEFGLKMYGHGPVPKLWYESSKLALDPGAVRYVDNLLAQTTPTPS